VSLVGLKNFDKLVSHIEDDRIRRCFQLLVAELNNQGQTITTIVSGGGGSGGGGGGGGTGAGTRQVPYEWTATGAWPDGSVSVDGVRKVSQSAGVITGVFLSRVSSVYGTTRLDLLRNGVTMYTTLGNRPTITTADTDGKICSLPDLVNVAIGDELTVNLVTNSGPPDSWTLQVIVE